MSALRGLAAAFGLLTVLPVRAARNGPVAPGWTIGWAPAVGVALGAGAGAAGVVAMWAGAGPLLAAVVVVASLAALTRGLHLDGLADTVDGLGSARGVAGDGPGEALRVMKAPDIGPFGVVAVVLVLLGQVAALAEAWDAGHGFAATVVAAGVGRAALLWGCGRGVPPARAQGLGASVAGSVPTPVASVLTLGTLGIAAGLGYADGAGWARPLLAAAAGLAAGLILLRHSVRRLGGVTGDVLGALVETATTVVLVAFALA